MKIVFISKTLTNLYHKGKFMLIFTSTQNMNLSCKSVIIKLVYITIIIYNNTLCCIELNHLNKCDIKPNLKMVKISFLNRSISHYLYNALQI